MQANNFQLTVDSSQVNQAIQQGRQKGWQLIQQQDLGDGQVILYFERASGGAQQIMPYTGGGSVASVNPDYAWLELIGLMGFYGIGYLVSGRVTDGLVRFFGIPILLIVGWIISALISFATFGVGGICLVPVMLVVQFGFPIWSALELKKDLERQAGIR